MTASILKLACGFLQANNTSMRFKLAIQILATLIGCYVRICSIE